MANFPDFAPDRNPADLLRDFVLALQALLDELMAEGRGPTGTPLFIPELLPVVQEAWRSGRGRVASFAATVRDLSATKINEHQLEGSPLKAKLGVIGHYARRFAESGTAILLRRLLQAIDTLLKSLTQASGAGGFLEELKETVENIIDDAKEIK
jgi:hypothetical protein